MSKNFKTFIFTILSLVVTLFTPSCSPELRPVDYQPAPGWERYFIVEAGASSLKAYIIETNGLKWEILEKTKKDSWSTDSDLNSFIANLSRKIERVSDNTPFMEDYHIYISNGFQNLFGLDDIINALEAYKIPNYTFVSEYQEAWWESITIGRKRDEVSVGIGGASTQLFSKVGAVETYYSIPIGANISSSVDTAEHRKESLALIMDKPPVSVTNAVLTGGTAYYAVKRYWDFSGQTPEYINVQWLRTAQLTYFSSYTSFASTFSSEDRDEKMETWQGYYNALTTMIQIMEYNGIGLIRLGKNTPWVCAASTQKFGERNPLGIR